MAIKIFCNGCQKFIKDANKVELRELDGNEICEDCLGATQTKITDIKRVAARGVKSIEIARDTALAELDRSIRKVIRAHDPE